MAITAAMPKKIADECSVEKMKDPVAMICGTDGQPEERQRRGRFPARPAAAANWRAVGAGVRHDGAGLLSYPRPAGHDRRGPAADRGEIGRIHGVASSCISSALRRASPLVLEELALGVQRANAGFRGVGVLRGGLEQDCVGPGGTLRLSA